MKIKNPALLIVSAVATLILVSCGGGESKKVTGSPDVIVHELSDADMLNPTNYTDAGAGYILKNIFQSLLEIDFKTLELTPVLAESRPQIEKTPEGGLRITYTIRPEAKWDNGQPITPQDVEFTLKVIKNPKVKNERIRPYYEFITDFVTYPEEPRKFTLVSNTVYILAEASSGDYSIIPEYFYDPKGLMKSFTIKGLTLEQDKYASDPKLAEFADDFNSEKRGREKEFISGSGAYKLEEWATGQRIVLTKKDNWWGSAIQNGGDYFTANAPKITYQTINDQTTALVALKAGNLDVMRSIKSKDFATLPESDKFNENFNAHTPVQLAYTYIGLNTRKPQLSDKAVRQALAHLIDVDKQIKIIKYGQAQRVVGPIHPSKKTEYNTEIVPFDYNPEKAKQMLTDAGWKDTDGDGVLDKVVNGQKVQMNLEFTYNSGNDERKSTALLLQEDARKVGININVVAQDWSVYLENLKNHKFDVFFGAWVQAPVPNDHKQIFHSESYNDGSNYTGFGSAASDALIDSIRVELDDAKRAAMNKRFQVMLHDESPYIFMYAPTERIAIHKRFTNAEPSMMRPGYWEAGFALVK
jgi:peptide/nickel transport system substrate-binding protein